METLELKRRLIERLSDSSAALICNAYDFLGMHSPCADWSIKCLTPELPPLSGEAITISLDCSTPDGETHFRADDAEPAPKAGLYYKMIELIEKSSLPKVVVIQSLGNYSYGAVIGDGMAKTMLAGVAAPVYLRMLAKAQDQYQGLKKQYDALVTAHPELGSRTSVPGDTDQRKDTMTPEEAAADVARRSGLPE